MKTIRLLTIGNSFAENALRYLEPIAASAGAARFEVGRANLGGCSLEKHWNLAVYAEAHAELGPYRLGDSPDGSPRMVSLREALSAEGWDAVTLQQVSRQSWLRESFEPHLGRLHGLVRERAPQAEILLHQTWAYRSDSPYLPENCLTQEIMHERIRENYRHYGAAYGCRVIPSGDAVQAARRAPGRGFAWPERDFDHHHAQAPELPRQAHSLAVGWYWAVTSTPDGIPRMQLDANHLNDRGCYLVGAAWFECLTGLDVRSASFEPPGLDHEDAVFLRRIAHEAASAGAASA